MGSVDHSTFIENCDASTEKLKQEVSIHCGNMVTVVN